MEASFPFCPLYTSACSRRKNYRKCVAEKRNSSKKLNYFPTLPECASLSKIIIDRIVHCTTFDVLGLSTQVMVLDEHAPLSVAFVAAQETKLGSGVIWNPIKRKFVGILSSSDHIKILLYCYVHPEETKEVSCWTIGHWLSIRSDSHLLSKGADPPSSDSSSHKSVEATVPSLSLHSEFVSCTTKATLKECLELMRQYNVHRLPVVAENELSEGSVVAMIDVQQIVEYLLLGKSAVDLVRAGGAAGMRICEEMEFSRRESEEVFYPPDADDDSNTGLLFLLKKNGNLPRSVSSIVTSGNHHKKNNRIAKIGPYSSIFDVPFRCLPMIGAHRHRAIFVTMENTIAEALEILLHENIESIAVCRKDRIVTDVIRRSDLLLMEQEGIYHTNISVREAIGSKPMSTVYVFHESDSMWNIFFHFVEKRVRELFMVDPETDELLGQLNIVEFVHFLAFSTAN